MEFLKFFYFLFCIYANLCAYIRCSAAPIHMQCAVYGMKPLPFYANQNLVSSCSVRNWYYFQRLCLVTAGVSASYHQLTAANTHSAITIHLCVIFMWGQLIAQVASWSHKLQVDHTGFKQVVRSYFVLNKNIQYLLESKLQQTMYED